MFFCKLILCARVFVVEVLKNNKLYPHKPKLTGFMVAVLSEFKGTFLLTVRRLKCAKILAVNRQLKFG
jgi:hypothetical protein